MALIDVREVQDILRVAESTAYSVIKRLNEELESKGYLTLRGKVEKKYLMQRYGLSMELEGDKS